MLVAFQKLERLILRLSLGSLGWKIFRNYRSRKSSDSKVVRFEYFKNDQNGRYLLVRQTSASGQKLSFGMLQKQGKLETQKNPHATGSGGAYRAVFPPVPSKIHASSSTLYFTFRPEPTASSFPASIKLLIRWPAVLTDFTSKTSVSLP